MEIFTVISGEEIYKYIRSNNKAIKKIIQDTYLAYSDGKVDNPNSYVLRFSDQSKTRIIALPSALRNNKPIAGIKWIGSNPDNLRYGLPRASATIILNDYETKYPIACLEGAIISATRTAYSAVLAAESLLNNNIHVKRIGIVGTSYIAKNIYQAIIDSNWEIEELLLFDISEKNADNFLQSIHSLCKDRNIRVNISQTIDDLITNSEVIIFATSALTPYISDFSLFKHNPLVLNISLRDLAPEILLSSNNVVDDTDNVLAENTSAHLAEKLAKQRNFINGNITDLFNKNIVLNINKPTIFSPMGMGMLDIALSQLIYDDLKDTDRVVKIPNFFYLN